MYFYIISLCGFAFHNVGYMLHVLATRNVFVVISLFMILCTFCKALSCKSLWIKVSAK